jgi:hypothetical protein
MEFLVGLSLALGVSLGGTLAGLDRERAFYTTVALAVGTYYILFAVMGGSSEALIREVLAFAVLAAVAVVGFRRNFWLVVVALAGHGLFDVFHARLIVNEGVPAYWPMFCMSYDVTAALYLAWLLRRRSFAAPLPKGGRPIGAYVQSELDAATALQASPAASFRRLERAHVLSQTSTWEHVRVHWHMLRWGLRQRDAKEIAGQVLRIVGAATKTAFGLVPVGNTGGANTSPLKRMPVSGDLAEILAAATGRATGKLLLPGHEVGPE